VLPRQTVSRRRGQGEARSPLAWYVAPTGCWVGAAGRRGRHEAGDGPTRSCLVVGVAESTRAVTTIVCLLITIQRVS
jgi:hypothetical protein